MPPATPVTQVIILADTALPRLAWTALLEKQPGLAIWGTAADLEGLRALPLPGNPTAVLLDFPQAEPQRVLQLAQAAPEAGLLCLVSEYVLGEIIALLQAGAAGVLHRDATVNDLALSLVAAGRGEIVLPSGLAARALAALARGEVPRQTTGEALTGREGEVLTLLAQGLTNKDIAQSLFLSVRTVEAHLRNIYGKLSVSSRTEAVLWAVQHGFEPPD